ncbi:hypothetical protein SUDANB70_02717 [Streptomyces sp. enrichment culture]
MTSTGPATPRTAATAAPGPGPGDAGPATPRTAERAPRNGALR